MTEGSPSGGHFQMASKIEARGVAPFVGLGIFGASPQFPVTGCDGFMRCHVNKL